MSVTVEWTTCPDEDCGNIAEIEWRDTAYATGGLVELAKVRCVRRHWFLLPVECLERSPISYRLRSA